MPFQVLIDSRDCPFVTHRSLTESVTYLGNHNEHTRLYTVPGLDYVAHEDILPYR
jgi:polymerase delta-interacting protein 2